MANLISLANGNLTSAATWATVDTTALISSSASGTALTTSALDSAVFVPGAITVDGIALKINLRNVGSPSNKMTVILRNSTGSADVKTVVVNVSDLPPCTSSDFEGGWHFFKFDAPVLLIAATNYVIRISLDSVSTPVSIQTNGTANNWQHMLRTTTTQAPSAGDDLHIMGEFNGSSNPATTSSRVITMDSTAATIYGANAVESPHTASLTISNRGTLNYGNAASTNYYLKIAGDLVVFYGGTFTIGTVASPIPRTSTAILEFSTVTRTYSFHVRKGATFTSQGLSRTSGKNIWSCFVNSNVAAAASTINVDTDTGWLSGDEVLIASTSRTNTETEDKLLSGDAGASSFGITVATSFAHLGVTPTKAEVALLTRNVKIRSSITTTGASALFMETSIVDIDWTEFKTTYLTTSTSTGGLFSLMYSSVRTDWLSGGLLSLATALWDNVTVQYVTFYSTINSVGFQSTPTTGINWVISDILFFTTNTAAFTLQDLMGTWDNLTSIGVTLNLTDLTGSTNISWANTPHLTAHGGGGVSLIGRFVQSVIASIIVWRNTNSGLILAADSVTGFIRDLTINSIILFGNTNQNISLGPGNIMRTKILSGSLSGDTTFSTTAGIKFVTGTIGLNHKDIIFDNVLFGPTSGIFVPHTNDIDFTSVTEKLQFQFRNCSFGSSVLFLSTSNLFPGSFLSSARHQQTSGNHLFWTPFGQITCDGTTYHTAAPSEKLAPSSATYKLESGQKLVALNSGSGCAVTVWVRKSSAYNGNAPRLIQKADPAVGLNTDSVLATFSGSADTWVQLSGTVGALSDNAAATMLIDCDGTAGAVFVDDWAVN